MDGEDIEQPVEPDNSYCHGLCTFAWRLTTHKPRQCPSLRFGPELQVNCMLDGRAVRARVNKTYKLKGNTMKRILLSMAFLLPIQLFAFTTNQINYLLIANIDFSLEPAKIERTDGAVIFINYTKSEIEVTINYKDYKDKYTYHIKDGVILSGEFSVGGIKTSAFYTYDDQKRVSEWFLYSSAAFVHMKTNYSNNRASIIKSQYYFNKKTEDVLLVDLKETISIKSFHESGLPKNLSFKKKDERIIEMEETGDGKAYTYIYSYEK